MNTLSARERTEESSYTGRFRKTSSRRIEKKIIYPDRDGKPMSDNPDGKKFLSPVESERLHKKDTRDEQL